MEILNKEAKDYAIEKLTEMVKKHMPNTDPQIVVEFYCCIDGRLPLKYTDMGRKLSSNRMGAQAVIRTFRERISTRGNVPEERTLSLFEVSRNFIWRVFREAQRRQKKRDRSKNASMKGGYHEKIHAS